MYSESFSEITPPDFNKITQYDVKKVLSKVKKGLSDLPVLLAPAAEEFLDTMALQSKKNTLKRFGANLQIFTPLYLSNLCTNICTYCGFSADVKLKRTWLRPHQLEEEIAAIKEKGIGHILLVTGEAEHKIGVPYFQETLQNLRKEFAHIQLEAQPLSTEEYGLLKQEGLDGVVVYQETYDRQKYSSIHLQGKKQDFFWRLNTADRIAQANIEKIGLGVLLGLSDWRTDALALANHINYLQNRYWQHKFSVGFPRLQSCASNYTPSHPASDKSLIQLYLAFRLCFDDLELVLSTRERPALRDVLIGLGITNISAESKTQPGGHSSRTETGLAQFDTSDNRSLSEVQSMIKAMNYIPLMEDNIPLS